MRKRLISYIVLSIFFIPLLILICYANQDNDDILSGIYCQDDGPNITGKYSLLFIDNLVYIGLKGDTQNEIINDVHHLDGSSLAIQGKKYTLTENKILIYKNDNSKIEWSFENGKVIVASGEIKENCVNSYNSPSLCTTSIDGVYKKK